MAGTRDYYYHRLPYECTQTEFSYLLRNKKPTTQEEEERYHLLMRSLTSEFNKAIEKAVVLWQDNKLTLSTLKAELTCGAVPTTTEDSFASLWRQNAETKKHNTRSSYIYALNSFENSVGKVKGFAVTIAMVRAWENTMVKDGLSRTTIGIYERAFRAVWNLAQEKGYVEAKDYPFGKRAGKISIPIGSSRKKEYLSVEKMTVLFEKFKNDKSMSLHCKRMLGLFLFQYLGNGLNVADIARLTYTRYYFATNSQALMFVRKKTEDRSSTEVIIPIIDELKMIMDEIGEPPYAEGLVFPWITGTSTSEMDIVKKIASMNGYIRKYLKKLMKELKWPEKVSSTWARHSFATNLAHQGVPQQYISEAMGHSTASGSVTQRYIDAFPLEKQMEFNSLLLGGKMKEKTVTISKEEFDELIRLKQLR